MTEQPKPFFTRDQEKLTLVFPLHAPGDITIKTDSSTPDRTKYIDKIDKVLREMLPGSSIDTLNQVTGQFGPEQSFMARVKSYIYNDVFSAPLQLAEKTVTGVTGYDVCFYNALVFAEAVNFEDGLRLVLAEAICIDESAKPRAFRDKLQGELSQIRVCRARMPIVCPNSGETIQEKIDIEQVILNRGNETTSLSDIYQDLKRNHIIQPMLLAGTNLASTARKHPGLVTTAAAVFGGAILAYFIHKQRSRRHKS